MPAWPRTYSSSWLRYAGLMFTSTAPTLAVAYGRSTHSAQFGDQMPTHEGLDGTAAEQIADVVLGWGG